MVRLTAPTVQSTVAFCPFLLRLVPDAPQWRQGSARQVGRNAAVAMRQAACYLPFVEESQFNARKLAKGQAHLLALRKRHRESGSRALMLILLTLRPRCPERNRLCMN